MKILLPTSTAGSLPKPSWLAQPEILWSPWKLEGEELVGGKQDALRLAVEDQRQAGITIVGDGEQTRAFSYISDVAPVIAEGPLIEKARNEVFNVGADTPYTVNVLAKEIKEALGDGSIWGHPRPGIPWHVARGMGGAVISHQQAPWHS